MQTEHWQKIETLFHETLSMDPLDRTLHLGHVCSGDESLQKEVESLISAFESSDGLLEQPAFELGIKVLQRNQTESLVGKTVGVYKVVERLGKGGMGEVFLAEDSRLGRKVALKFLSPEFIGDDWAKRQLIKEAQAAAKLDHPNICPVYGIEEHEGHSFIVMQHVEGETVADLIRANGLLADQMVPLARQIVSAVAEAHANGIIHRDIKPRNIMVTKGGQVKVLDFGLAKTIQEKWSSEIANDSVSDLSQIGVVPGTVAYMSPEQLRAERLDYNSDIFSIGIVLYEMVTGTNPFAKQTNAEVIAAILSENPASFKQTSERASCQLDRVVKKCLQKQKEERYQSARNLLMDLESDPGQVERRSIIRTYLNIRTATALFCLLLIAVVSILIYSRLNRSRSVAVLPIINASGDPSLDYLGEGLTESIINKLSGLSKLRVKPLTLVSGFKEQGTDAAKAGRDLNVDAILVGQITGNRGSLVLRTSLIRTKDGAQLWNEQRPIALENVFPIEQEVSRKVTSTLELWPQDDENRIRRARQPTNPEARNEYMLGRYYWRNRDNNRSLKDAIKHFSAAIRIEPNYAEAYAGLADCYALGNVVSYPDLGLTTSEAMHRAERAAKDALELDGDLAEAHTSLGFVNMRLHRNWQEAEKKFRKAIELKPDYALAYYGYSNLRAIIGPESEAIALSLRAKELDPFSPVTAFNYCRTYYYAHRYEESSTCFDKLVQDKPDYANGQYGRGIVYLQRGLHRDAIAILEGLYAKDKRGAGAALGYAYGATGNKNEARRVLGEMELLSNQVYVPPQEFALLYLGLNDNEKTFFWLQRAVNEHVASTAYLAVDPIYAPIRSDARFLELARSLNLPLQQN